MQMQAKRSHFAALPRDAGKTSYWLSDTNEMAAIKTILIIVNRRRLKVLMVHRFLGGTGKLRRLLAENKAKSGRVRQTFP
jgi:hypothetical protein